VARRPSSSKADSTTLPRLTMPRAELDRRIEERIARGHELVSRPIKTTSDLQGVRADYRVWNDYNITLLRRAFTTSEPADDYNPPMGALYTGVETLEDRVDYFHAIAQSAIQRLASLKERLELFEEETEEGPSAAPGPARAPTGTAIFVVHGRSEAPKQEVARFLDQVTNLRPVILHEQPSSGRTIIEKFEDHAATAAFAVVLLTGDDEGSLLGSDDRRRRARQNVIFELGFFIASLGRPYVAVLHESDVELPSDMSGVLYTPLDPNGAWRTELAREMRAAGIEVDLNRAL
jgi:predicted nucleotide-binding protein